MTSVSDVSLKVAVATELPNTSCAHVTVAAGVTIKSCAIKQRLRLSRGRSINRCGPNSNGSRNWYIVWWCIESVINICLHVEATMKLPMNPPINGETHYLWRAVHHEGEVLEFFPQNAGIVWLRLSLLSER